MGRARIRITAAPRDTQDRLPSDPLSTPPVCEERCVPQALRPFSSSPSSAGRVLAPLRRAQAAGAGACPGPGSPWAVHVDAILLSVRPREALGNRGPLCPSGLSPNWPLGLSPASPVLTQGLHGFLPTEALGHGDQGVALGPQDCVQGAICVPLVQPM